MISYVFQHPDFALGNFINLTPAIRWMAEQVQSPVPVYFSHSYVRDCFLRCPFIHILHMKPDNDPMFTSAMTNQNDDRPDYQYIFNVITGGMKWNDKYHTYVDESWPEEIPGNVMMINGSGSESEKYTQKKDVGPEPYRRVKEIVGEKKVLVACGSYSDLYRASYMAQFATFGCWNNMVRTLQLMKGASCIIANDTGLAHAAGAMNKPLLVLWKNTPRERCKNAGTQTEYSYENHEENIQIFLEKHL